jgi:hypothetical protein
MHPMSKKEQRVSKGYAFGMDKLGLMMEILGLYDH